MPTSFNIEKFLSIEDYATETRANGKFDVCLMNPPYDNGLGNKFLLKVLGIADRVCTVQPLSWLIAKKQDKNITNKVDKFDTYIETINGNISFDGSFNREIQIQYFDTTKNGKIHIYGNEYDKCEDVKVYSNDNYIKDFIEKIIPVKNNLWNNIKGSAKGKKNFEPNPNPDWWCLKVQRLRDRMDKSGKNLYEDNFFTIISNNEELIKNTSGKYSKISKIPNKMGHLDFLYFAFDTEKELNGFINYIKTDFVRGILRAVKKSVVLRDGFQNIPWQDFTNPVFARSPKQIDDYLFKKYNIGNDIRQHIEEILPDYYGIRK